MTLTPELRRFCLAHSNAVLVPAEALTQTGMSSELSALLVEEKRLTTSQVHTLERGFALYWEHCADLFKRAPGSWFPPRQTNLLIAAEPRGILLYLEPFKNASSLLYVDDLESDAEYVAYLLIHMERLSLLRSPGAAVVHNLSYWFNRDEHARQAFAAAARRSRRPDAPCFIAVADSLTWVDGLVHVPLRGPQTQPTESLGAIEGADLYVPQQLQPLVIALANAADASARSAMQQVAVASSGGSVNALDDLCDWLCDQRALAILVAPDGTTLWRPNMDDANRVRRALASVPDEAVASIHADVRVIDARSRQFLEAVVNVDELPRRCAVLEAGDGTYVDAAKRSIVHELKQPFFDARLVPAPPYARLQLGARVMHEWGHIAHTARLIRLPEERKPEYRQARAELGEQFANVLSRVPARLADDVASATAALAPSPAQLPAALARKTLARVGDYLANLMCSRFISGEEMQAYVRTNVRHHFDEDLDLVSHLGRYAYEIHYLALAGLPRSYFFAISRFNEYFIEPGLVAEDDVHALFDAVGRVLACYEIDTSRLTLPAAPAAAFNA
jgi:hypothetical protein